MTTAPKDDFSDIEGDSLPATASGDDDKNAEAKPEPEAKAKPEAKPEPEAAKVKTDAHGPTMVSIPPEAPKAKEREMLPTEDAPSNTREAVLVGLASFRAKINEKNAQGVFVIDALPPADRRVQLSQRSEHLHALLVRADANPAGTPEEAQLIAEMKSIYHNLSLRLQALDHPAPAPANMTSSGHTDAFMREGDAQSAENLAAQARLDATQRVDASKAPKAKRSPILAKIGYGCLIVLAVVLLVAGGHWIATHLFGHESDQVATTVVGPPTPTTTADGTYACRAGSEVADCGRVEDFILAHGEGESYWECSGMSPEHYRSLFTVEDPTGTRRIVANWCECQYCEPIAH